MQLQFLRRVACVTSFAVSHFFFIDLEPTFCLSRMSHMEAMRFEAFG